MASHEDIYIDQGAVYTAEVTVKKDNVDFDLSTYTFSGQIRKTVGNSTVAATFDINTDSQLSNVLEISLTDTQTSALTSTRYVYDIEATADDSQGTTYRIVQGNVVVSPNVTR